MTETGQRLRMVAITALVMAAWVVLGVRVFALHIGDNEARLAHIKDIHETEADLVEARGRIFDCKGNILVADVVRNHVAVDPSFTRQHGYPRFTAYQLSRLLHLDPAEVLSALGREGQYAILSRFVEPELAQQVAALNMPGVVTTEVWLRHYPHGPLMSHVLGYANAEGDGSAGLEQRYDRYLRSVKGLRVTELDAEKREVFSRRALEIEACKGADVHLTLDQNLQYFVEKALDDAMAQHQAQYAMAVLQRVQTGEILAMASRPAFDPNAYGQFTPTQRMNRAIAATYEPGSTFKIAVIAAALNEGVVTPGQVFDCENGLWMHGGRPLRDYHPHGLLSVADILKKSSNIGAAKIALLLGPERLYRYLRDFGVGKPSGIALPGEEGGILAPPSRWSSLSITRIAMGHEVAITPLQMAGIMSALANGGRLMKPRVVQRVVSPDGVLMMEESEPEVLSTPIRPETSRIMRQLLARVTEEGGTGTRARVEGYTVAGKTGTAQKPVAGGYSSDANIASFCGFLPAESPEFSLIVVVDEPQPLHTGGLVAAPVFRAIAEQAVRYLDIPAVQDTERFAFHPPTRPALP